MPEDSEVLFTAKINGKEREVTLAQAKRYAEQAGALAEQAQYVQQEKEELDNWKRFKDGFQRDPHGTMAELAQASGGSYVNGPAGKESKTEEDDSEDPTIAELRQELRNLRQEVEGTRTSLSSFQVSTSVEKEIESLRRDNPSITDEQVRSVMGRASNYGGLPLAEAWKLQQFEDMKTATDKGDSPEKVVPKTLPTSNGPGSNGSRIESNTAQLDYTKPLKDLFDDAWENLKD